MRQAQPIGDHGPRLFHRVSGRISPAPEARAFPCPPVASCIESRLLRVLRCRHTRAPFNLKSLYVLCKCKFTFTYMSSRISKSNNETKDDKKDTRAPARAQPRIAAQTAEGHG